MIRHSNLLGGALALVVGLCLVLWALYMSLGSPPPISSVAVNESTGKANCIPGRRGDDLYIDGTKYYLAYDRVWGVTSGACDRTIRGIEVRVAWVEIGGDESIKRLVVELSDTQTGRRFGPTREKRIAELVASTKMGASDLMTIVSQLLLGLTTIALSVRLLRNSGNGKHN